MGAGCGVDDSGVRRARGNRSRDRRQQRQAAEDGCRLGLDEHTLEQQLLLAGGDDHHDRSDHDDSCANNHNRSAASSDDGPSCDGAADDRRTVRW